MLRGLVVLADILVAALAELLDVFPPVVPVPDACPVVA